MRRACRQALLITAAAICARVRGVRRVREVRGVREVRHLPHPLHPTHVSHLFFYVAFFLPVPSVVLAPAT